jgi:hypothetical protein
MSGRTSTLIGRAADQVTLPRIRNFALTAVTAAAAVVALLADREAARMTAVVVGGVCLVLLIILAGRTIVRQADQRVRRPVVLLRNRNERLRRVLSNLVEDDSHPFHEEMTIRYRIGLDGADDKVVRVMRTSAATGARLHWRKISERNPDHVGQRLSLASVNFHASVQTAGHTLEQVGLASEPNRMLAMVAFFPPIEHRPVDWTVMYDWPHSWDALRLQGYDSQKLTIPSDSWSRVEVIFEFPEGTQNAMFTRPPPGGQTSMAAAPGQPVSLRWLRDGTGPGQFEFRFRASLPPVRATRRV